MDYPIKSINRIQGTGAFAVSVLLVIVLGLVDYYSGHEISFSIFYLIPISLTVYSAGFKYGVAVALISAITWFNADIFSGAEYSNYFIPCWNAVMRLGYFLIHSLLLSRILNAYEEMKKLSFKDSLTGVPNWRCFEDFSKREMAKAKRGNKGLTICYIDIDNFKVINDALGHEKGNGVIKTVAGLINKNLRLSDMVARVGGDEFVILIPESDYGNANEILLRVIDEVREKGGNGGMPVSISMGAVTYKAIHSSVENMVKEADELMYKVKKEGKDNLLHREDNN